LIPSITPGRPRSCSLLAAVLTLTLVVPVAAQGAELDTDGDGLRDDFERTSSLTSPERRDSDRDGIADAVEDEDGDKLGNLGEQRFGTDPGDPDSDDDGILDGEEDSDGDGRTDAQSQDRRPVPGDLRPPLARADEDANGIDVWCGVNEGRSMLRHCRFGDPQSDVHVVLMGDSKAHSLLLPFRRAAHQEGWHVETVIKGGCLPWLGITNGLQQRLDKGRSCRTWRRAAIKWLEDREPTPDLVVVASSDRYALAQRNGDIYDKDSWPARWEAAVERTVAALPQGTAALILGDVPYNYGDPVRCLRENPRDISACAYRRQDPDERIIALAQRAGAEATGATFGTLNDVICPYDPCPPIHDDVLVWRDRSHISGTFSGYLTPRLRALVREALP